ncbi:hypothetical protein [Chitinophaga japonensis]|nr:hypothetical protein [Chitinophaga japonensis]
MSLLLLGSMYVHNGTDNPYAPMQPIQVRINEWQERQALIYTPEKPVPGKKYPLLICFHGKSIAGTDLSRIFRQGVARQLREGKKIAAVNPKDKHLYEFIVLTPLSLSWSWPPQDMEGMLDDIMRRYPVDPARIYLTGYSAGGWAVESAKTHSARLTKRIAACVTMSPPITDNPYLKRYKLVADAGIHTWYFAGEQEAYFLHNVHTFIDSTDHYRKGLTRITEFKGGHCCWQSFYNPDYRENGMSIYEWMLQYTTKN